MFFNPKIVFSAVYVKLYVRYIRYTVITAGVEPRPQSSPNFGGVNWIEAVCLLKIFNRKL